jgi:hypothetical protein
VPTAVFPAPPRPRSPAPCAHQAGPSQLVYELRVLALAGPAPGTVLRAQRLCAAQCLTSLQFSPTCEHLLLAYGRRHAQLCCLLPSMHDGSVSAVFTVLEVVRWVGAGGWRICRRPAQLRRARRAQ